jgi:hypothetical protein
LRKIRITERNKSITMLSARIPRKNPESSSFLKPVLPLLPEVLPKTEENKKLFITMELKNQAGKLMAGSYKKHLALFDEGTPQQWIDTHKDILEVWTQNSINGPSDRMAIVTAVLRGESLTTFEAAITDAKAVVDVDGKATALSNEMVEEALAEVATTISPTELWNVRNSG